MLITEIKIFGVRYEKSCFVFMSCFYLPFLYLLFFLWFIKCPNILHRTTGATTYGKKS